MKNLFFSSLFFFFIFTSPALAQDIPDITGKWSGKSQVHSVNHPYLQGENTILEITKQKSNLFEGTKSYYNTVHEITFTEKLSGSISPTGLILIAEHQDGYLMGQIQDDGSLILQYAECGSTSHEPKAAFYHFTRE
ncbi:MAG: hypothetical protein ACOCV7_04555 [Desulfonatronovibrionaceae bacterium]